MGGAWCKGWGLRIGSKVHRMENSDSRGIGGQAGSSPLPSRHIHLLPEPFSTLRISVMGTAG